MERNNSLYYVCVVMSQSAPHHPLGWRRQDRCEWAVDALWLLQAVVERLIERTGMLLQGVAFTVTISRERLALF